MCKRSKISTNKPSKRWLIMRLGWRIRDRCWATNYSAMCLLTKSTFLTILQDRDPLHFCISSCPDSLSVSQSIWLQLNWINKMNPSRKQESKCSYRELLWRMSRPGDVPSPIKSSCQPSLAPQVVPKMRIHRTTLRSMCSALVPSTASNTFCGRSWKCQYKTLCSPQNIRTLFPTTLNWDRQSR